MGLNLEIVDQDSEKDELYLPNNGKRLSAYCESFLYL